MGNTVTESERRSLLFYEQLGAARLAARTAPEWDRAICEQLTAMLRPGQHILDLGCGYGRIAIPLALAGHAIVAMDLSSSLLGTARALAAEQHAAVVWIRASMRQLPVAAERFDVVLCLWTVFYELLTEEEQLQALTEIIRVLRNGGWALIEGPPHSHPGDAARPRRSRVAAVTVDGLTNFHYQHDARSLTRLVRKLGRASGSIYTATWGGRERQFLQLRC